jgi:hypothetical protein
MTKQEKEMYDQVNEILDRTSGYVLREKDGLFYTIDLQSKKIQFSVDDLKQYLKEVIMDDRMLQREYDTMILLQKLETKN